MQKQLRYAIRKTTLGVGSIAISALLMGAPSALAAENGNDLDATIDEIHLLTQPLEENDEVLDTEEQPVEDVVDQDVEVVSEEAVIESEIESDESNDVNELVDATEVNVDEDLIESVDKNEVDVDEALIESAIESDAESNEIAIDSESDDAPEVNEDGALIESMDETEANEDKDITEVVTYENNTVEKEEEVASRATDEKPTLKYNPEKGYPENTHPGNGTIYIGDKVVDDSVKESLSEDEQHFVNEIQYLLNHGVLNGKVVFPTLQALVDEGIVTQDGDQWTAHLKGGETLNDLDLVFETEDGQQFSFDQMAAWGLDTLPDLFGLLGFNPALGGPNVFEDSFGRVEDRGFDNTYGYGYEADVSGYGSPVLNAFKSNYDVSNVYHPFDQYRLGLIDLETLKKTLLENPSDSKQGLYFYHDPKTGDYARVTFGDFTENGKLGLARASSNNYGLIMDDVDAETLSHISRGVGFSRAVESTLRNSLDVYHGLEALGFYESSIFQYGKVNDEKTVSSFKQHKETLEDLLQDMPIYKIFSDQLGIDVIRESFDTVAQWAIDRGYVDKEWAQTFKDETTGYTNKYALFDDSLDYPSGRRGRIFRPDIAYGVGNPWIMDYDRILEHTPDLTKVRKADGEVTQVVNYVKRVPTPKGHVLKIDQDGNVLKGESFESGDGLINYGDDFKYEIKETAGSLFWSPVFQHEFPYYVDENGKVYRMEYLYGPSSSMLDVAQDRLDHPERYTLFDWSPVGWTEDGYPTDLGNSYQWILDHVPGERDIRTFPGMEGEGVSLYSEAWKLYTNVYESSHIDVDSFFMAVTGGKAFGTPQAEGAYPVMFMVYNVVPDAPDPVITTVTEAIPFETEYVDDPNLPIGEEVVDQAGVEGEKTITTTTLTIDGEVVYSDSEETIVKEPVNAIIRRGTKEVIEDIPYETEERENPELPEGERKVIQEGKPGKKNVHTGEIVEQPVPEIIEIGTKIVTEDIEFATEERENPELPQGERKVIQEGKPGKKNVYTGEVIEQPVPEIIEIGTKIVTEDIEFATEERENPELPEGERKVIQEGKPGKKNVYTGEVIEQPVPEIIEIGTKIVTEDIEFATEERENPELPQGERKVVQEGRPGKKNVHTGEVIEQPVPEIIEIGTKVVTEDIEFATEERENPELPQGERKVIQEGKPGKKTVHTGEVIEQPVPEIIEIGTKIVTEDIEFATEERENPELPQGERKVIQEGKPGKKNVYTGEVIEQPVPEIIEIGTKIVTEDIEFATEERENPELPEGERKVIQEGKPGKKNVYTGEVIEQPVPEIIEIGTKIVTEDIEFATEERENPELPQGERKVIQEGKPGKRNVHTGEIVEQPVPEIIEIGTKVITEDIEFATEERENPELPKEDLGDNNNITHDNNDNNTVEQEQEVVTNDEEDLPSTGDLSILYPVAANLLSLAGIHLLSKRKREE